MPMLLLRFAFAMERHRLGGSVVGGQRGKVVKRVVPNSKSQAQRPCVFISAGPIIKLCVRRAEACVD